MPRSYIDMSLRRYRCISADSSLLVKRAVSWYSPAVTYMPEKPPQSTEEPSFEGSGPPKPQGDIRKSNARYREYNSRSKRPTSRKHIRSGRR
jgi:hypothetical protein